LDEGVRALGFRRLLPDHMLSRILTAYIEPTRSDFSFDAMHDALYQRGYTIYPGKGAHQNTFRLANMGAITPDDMRGFVKTLGELIEEKRWRPLYP
jgi:2-aminoethylphosphonate-pyruvate transaminase